MVKQESLILKISKTASGTYYIPSLSIKKNSNSYQIAIYEDGGYPRIRVG